MLALPESIPLADQPIPRIYRIDVVLPRPLAAEPRMAWQPIPDPSGGTCEPDRLPSDPTIYLPPSWSLWPVQAAPEVGLKPESDAFFQHDHIGWQQIPKSQAEQLRLAGETLLDHAINYMLGTEDKSSLTNASNDFFRKVQRLVTTGDTKPRSRPKVNPFQFINKDQPIQGQQRAVEGQRLGLVLRDLLGLEVEPGSGTLRSGEYRYHLHPDTQHGDGLDIECLRPDRTDYLVCMTPAYDKIGVEAAMADLKRQYDEVAARSVRRFAHVVDEQGVTGKVVVERGPIIASSGNRADVLIAQYQEKVMAAGQAGFKSALEDMRRVKQQ